MTLREASDSDVGAIAALVRAQNEREGADDGDVPAPRALVHLGAADGIDAAGWIEAMAGGRSVLRVYSMTIDAAEALMHLLMERAPGDRLLRIERVLRPQTPSLPDQTTAMYARNGFVFVYIELEMARDLAALTDTPMVDGVRIEHWLAAGDARLRDAYNDAFSTRGFAGYSEDKWRDERFSAQPDFLADASVVARAGDEIVGFSMCMRDGDDGWIDSAGVRPMWRGRGIVDALLWRSMQTMREVGMQRVVLRVNEDNARAVAVYRRLGFEATRKHAVWAKDVQA